MKSCPKPQKTKKVKKKRVVSERKKLIDDCDKLWSLCIKKRDKTCRYTNSDFGLQAHHIRSRIHFSTRWLLDNGLTLSNKVHCLQKMNPELFQDKVIEIIGQDFYDQMKKKSQIRVDYSIADLIEQKELLKAKLQELKLGDFNKLVF
jgi:hypothetical protein